MDKIDARFGASNIQIHTDHPPPCGPVSGQAIATSMSTASFGIVSQDDSRTPVFDETRDAAKNDRFVCRRDRCNRLTRSWGVAASGEASWPAGVTPLSWIVGPHQETLPCCLAPAPFFVAEPVTVSARKAHWSTSRSRCNREALLVFDFAAFSATNRYPLRRKML